MHSDLITRLKVPIFWLLPRGRGEDYRIRQYANGLSIPDVVQMAADNLSEMQKTSLGRNGTA